MGEGLPGSDEHVPFVSGTQILWDVQEIHPEKTDLPRTMGFQHMELGREGFAGRECWKL